MKTDGSTNRRPPDRLRPAIDIRGEQGFTLIELLATSAVLVVVLTAILALLDDTTKLSSRDRERPLAIRDAQVGLARMTRELRQATQVYSVSASRAEVKVNVSGTDRRVLYACDIIVTSSSYRKCTRTSSTNLATALSPATAPVILETVANGISSDPVFSYSSGSSYLTVRVVVPENPKVKSDSARRTTLSDAVYMRNVGSI